MRGQTAVHAVICIDKHNVSGTQLASRHKADL